MTKEVWIVALALCQGAACAQTWPAKPIRFLQPNAQGGLTDIVSRMNAQDLGPRLGQPVIVDNRPSAGGILAAELCAKASPDGYTLCAVNGNMLAMNVFLGEKLPYDPQKDFALIALLYFVGEALVVNPGLPVKSVQELRDYARSQKGGLNFATLGPRQGPDLFRSWLNRQWQTEFVGIPYKGGGNIGVALMAGEVQVNMLGLGNYVPLIQSGKLRLLAVGGGRRAKLFPDVPTFDEAGLGGYGVRTWVGVAGTQKTPDPVVRRLNAEFIALFKQARYIDYMESNGLVDSAGIESPEQFAAHLKKEFAAAAELVKLADPPPR